MRLPPKSPRRRALQLEALEERSLLTVTPWPASATDVVPLSISQITSNATGFDDSHIWIAVFGQLIETPQAGQVPATGPTYYLDSNITRVVGGATEPDPQSTGLLSAGPDNPDAPVLPSSTIADWGNNLSLPVPPDGQQYTGRILISAGAPVQAQVAADGSVSAPSAGNPTDPSTGTFYDFLEFTITNNGGVPQTDIDTSQVDSFGMPIQLQLFQDAAGTMQYPSGNVTDASNANPIVITSANHGLTTGDNVTVSGVMGNTAANGAFTVTVIDANTFSLNGSTGNGNYTSGGFWTTGGGPVGVQVDRSTIFQGSTNTTYLEFIRNQVLAGNTNANPFLEDYAAQPNTQSSPITGATNASPIVITSANHDLTTGDVIEVSGVGGNTAANGIFTVTVVDANTFSLDGSQGNGAYTSGGTWSSFSVPLRLVAPKDVTGELSATSTDPMNTYFDSTIDDFFLQYLPSNQTVNGKTGGGQTFSLVSQASGSSLTYTGNVQLVDGTYVLQLQTPTDTTVYDIYYPFFTTDTTGKSAGNLPSNYTPLFPPGVAPSWFSVTQAEESPTQMVFACNGVFADNTVRPNFDSNQIAVLGDLENSISAAFNRGIALSSPSTWGDTTTWYPTNGIYSYWVEYWHQNGLAINNQAYAFPYDDKFGTSTNLQENNVGLIKVTLQDWGSGADSTTAFSNFPSGTIMQGGQVTLTANVTGTNPTGTVTFYINGVAINSTNSGPNPLPQPVAINGSGVATLTANLPALPDGGHTHTYTVTAVYSGDSNNLPSLAAQRLKLTGNLGDFAVNLNPATGTLGTSVAVTTLLPGNPTSGTVDYSLVDLSGNTLLTFPSVTVTSSTVNTNVTIPSNLVTFTGNTTFGSDTITNVSTVENLIVNQGITGLGIPAGATVKSFVNSPGQYSVTPLPRPQRPTRTRRSPQMATLLLFYVKAVYGSLAGEGAYTVSVPTGSSVASVDFAGAAGNFSKATLHFNQAIDPTTFTTADVLSLTDPNGKQITPVAVVPVGTDGLTFDVSFAPQSTLGKYSITLGTDILDTDGNQLDQNHNGINGQNPADQFTGSESLITPQAPILAVGGSDGSVRIFDAATGNLIVTANELLDVPGSPYKGLVEVALGDQNGDGISDLFIAAANPAGLDGLDASKAGRVFVYDGATLLAGTVPTSPIRQFVPFAKSSGPAGSSGVYTNGLNIAVADVDGDGHVDLIAGTRSRTGSVGTLEYGRLVVIDGTSAAGSNVQIGSILTPFGSGYQKGVVVGAGDLDGNGKAEIAVTRGGPVAASNPNKTVKLKAYRLNSAGTVLSELNLSGTGSPLAPFEGVGSGTNVIDRDARVTFVDQNGDGIDELVFSALDPISTPGNIQVRIAVFTVDTATGRATPVGVGTGPSQSYLVGTNIVDHAITGIKLLPNAPGNLVLITESATSKVEYLDPVQGTVNPGGFSLNVLHGGVAIDGN
ncbi:MAG: beta-1,3-glucanase family protein [Gemmataceae bacterium]